MGASQDGSVFCRFPQEETHANRGKTGDGFFQAAMVIAYGSILEADEHPCTPYFDVHQRYRVLTHSQMI